jgi:ferredoxin
MLYINPVECIDSGACEPVCPQDAIFHDQELPEPLAHYLAVNAEVFATPDAFPGPATQDGDVRGIDHPLVAGA